MFGLSIWFDLLPVQAEKEETETWLFKVKQTEAEEERDVYHKRAYTWRAKARKIEEDN